MKFNITASAFIPMLALAACQTVQPVQYSIAHLNNHYVGLDAKEFFYRYGQPAGEMISGNDKFYSWVSPAPHVAADEMSEAQPATYSRTESESMYRAHDSNSDETETTTTRIVEEVSAAPAITQSSLDANTPDSDSSYITKSAKATPPVAEWENTAEPYCQLEIHTDARDLIQHISMINDSMGKRSASRCSELFATPSVL